jgi:hypothetical protein
MKIEALKEMIKFVGRDLGPREDWLPVLFLEKDKTGAIIGLPLLQDAKHKNACAAIMFDMIRRTNPDAACFISTAWVSSPEKDSAMFTTEREIEGAYDLGILQMPSKDPNRKEAVTAMLIDPKNQSALMIGYIERSKDKPPKIVKWIAHKCSPKGEVAGRFGEAMAKGFANADKNGNLDILQTMKGTVEEVKKNDE